MATPDGQSPLHAQEMDGLIAENGEEHDHSLGQDDATSARGLGGGGGGGDPEVEPDRPYPCEVCGRKFIRATHLRRHMRIHTGEKPFACHICGRRYARGDYLRAHIHAHRRDKIHKCKHCGEVFHDLTRFADHCRLIHKDLSDEFGNPKPPPESSPPPPNFSSLLEPSFIVEEAEEITVIPSINMMNMSNISSSVPITLVTLPESSEMDITYKDMSAHSTPSTVSHTLPTPNHTPMTSPELQLAQLQALAAHTDPHLLIQNGQLQVGDSANEIVYGHSSHGKATPISYIDSVTQYIYADGSNHSNTATIYPTPQPSPLVDQNHPHSSR